MMNEQPRHQQISDAAPTTLDHVVAAGENAKAKERIHLALESCYATGEPMPHTLIAGSPGTGKTLYATVISHELGQDQPLVVLGQTLDGPASVNGVLLGLSEKQVLIVDEIHTLDVDCQHTFLRALENREIFLDGSGPIRKPKTIKLPPFTLVGCTTNPEQCLQPLLDRFRLILHLSPYGVDELVALLRQRARTLGWQVEHDDVLLAVASRSRGTPRIALRLLESIRRTATAVGSAVLRVGDALRTFDLEGLDALGLGKVDRDYLDILYEMGKPVRLNVLATRLSMPQQSVVKLIETHLVREGLVNKGDGGRCLTERGIEYCRPIHSTD